MTCEVRAAQVVEDPALGIVSPRRCALASAPDDAIVKDDRERHCQLERHNPNPVLSTGESLGLRGPYVGDENRYA